MEQRLLPKFNQPSDVQNDQMHARAIQRWITTPDRRAASDPGTWLNRFHHGDAAAVLDKLPPDSIDTVITSPPYYRQRDYDDSQQVGHEPTPEEYIARLAQIFSGVQRVLKSSGALWLVIGDKFIDGELAGLPWQLALRLKAQGWRLRADVIWHKPNAMPSSVKTRPTVDHEYVFFFTKSIEYFYDADAIREPHVTFSPASRMRGGRGHFGRRGGTPEKGKNRGNQNLHDARWDQAFHPLGRNKRTVWSIPLSKFREAHFAVFPEPLVETCLRATCPPGGVVLDPFSGSGTTAVVAQRLGFKFVAIDCSVKYCQMGAARMQSVSQPKGTSQIV